MGSVWDARLAATLARTPKTIVYPVSKGSTSTPTSVWTNALLRMGTSTRLLQRVSVSFQESSVHSAMI